MVWNHSDSIKCKKMARGGLLWALAITLIKRCPSSINRARFITAGAIADVSIIRAKTGTLCIETLDVQMAPWWEAWFGLVRSSRHARGYTPLAVVSCAHKTLRVSATATDRAYSRCFVERGHCDRRCTVHVKIPSGSSLTSDTWIIAE
jgi:hypothetical protein